MRLLDSALLTIPDLSNDDSAGDGGVSTLIAPNRLTILASDDYDGDFDFDLDLDDDEDFDDDDDDDVDDDDEEDDDEEEDDEFEAGDDEE